MLELTERLIEIADQLLTITKEQNRILQQLEAARYGDALMEIESSLAGIQERADGPLHLKKGGTEQRDGRNDR